MASSKSVNIVRSRPRIQFTALPNRVANDDRLSAIALGVLYYILTKPVDWRVVPQQLGARFRMSYRRTLKVIGELSEAGYIKREIVIENYRITGTKYLVTDEPGFFGEEVPTASIEAVDDTASEPFVDFRACSKSSQTENRHPIQRTESHKTEINPKSETGASSQGLAIGNRGKAAGFHRPSKPDRGRIELEIANRIGDRGFEVLMALPESEVEALCARQRRGTLDDISIIQIRNKFMHPT